MLRSLVILMVIAMYSMGGAGTNLLYAQTSYLDHPDLLEKVAQGLEYTYNYDFDEASKIQEELQQSTPDHPAPVFLEALIIYWTHFPLLPDNPAADRFIALMDRCVVQSEDLKKTMATYQEGIFFDLFGRAFKLMFWADNGKSGKVVPELRHMYKNTKEGKELKDQFVEFYFSTGMYNYYIEAYADAHPVYRPLLAFMQKGDKAQGLKQLNRAINEAVFLKVEALLFMSLIQLQYEENLNTAAIYARRLHREYPQNTYYQGHLLTILLHLHRYKEANELLEGMADQKDPWTEMNRILASAFMGEAKGSSAAEDEYWELLDLAENFGPMANTFAAMAYMGLSRVYKNMAKGNDARRFTRKASRHTACRLILEGQAKVSR